jgi:hypothetical protein
VAQPDQLLAQLRTQANTLRHEADRLKAQSTQAKVIFSFPKSVSSSISDPDPHTGRPKLSPKKGKKEEISCLKRFLKFILNILDLDPPDSNSNSDP